MTNKQNIDSMLVSYGVWLKHYNQAIANLNEAVDNKRFKESELSSQRAYYEGCLKMTHQAIRDIEKLRTTIQ